MKLFEIEINKIYTDNDCYFFRFNGQDLEMSVNCTNWNICKYNYKALREIEVFKVK